MRVIVVLRVARISAVRKLIVKLMRNPIFLRTAQENRKRSLPIVGALDVGQGLAWAL